MTVLQVLFIIALLIPIAGVLIYFIVNMMDDYHIIRDETEDRDVAAGGRIPSTSAPKKKRTTQKKQRVIKKTKKTSRQTSEPAARPRAQEPVRRKQYYNPKEIKVTADYPQDPFANYKRPDLDRYVQDATARDHATRETTGSYTGERQTVKTKTKRSVRKRRK